VAEHNIFSENIFSLTKDHSGGEYFASPPRSVFLTVLVGPSARLLLVLGGVTLCMKEEVRLIRRGVLGSSWQQFFSLPL
jgi:hypothetical protein